MIWPFGRNKTFLDPDDEEWHLATWGWLLARFGREPFRRGRLVVASAAFFPPTEATGHARAEHIFTHLRRHAGMEDWPCELVAQDERPRTRVAELGEVKIESGHMPAGTFFKQGDAVVISYDPETLAHPVTFIAVLAHELAHYLIHSAADLPPGQRDMEECATDLTVAYLGFGCFGANSAFNFSQFRGVYSQGWRTSGLGYLRERDWAFALAIYCALRDELADTLKPWLKGYLYKDLRTAARYVSKTPKLLETIAQHEEFYRGQG